MQAVERLLPRRRGELALLHELGQRLLHRLAAVRDLLLVQVARDDVEAGDGGHLGNAAAHESAPQHADLLDLTHLGLGLSGGAMIAFRISPAIVSSSPPPRGGIWWAGLTPPRSR